MIRTFEPGLQDKTPQGEMNFIGAVIRYFNVINERWAESTQAAYYANYTKTLFCVIDPSVPVREYNAETVEGILYLLRSLDIYDENTIRNRFVHLLIDPCRMYFKERRLPDPFWGMAYSTETERNISGDRILFIKKSLTEKEEQRMAEILLQPETDKGEKVGLAVMAYCGARNNEAAALDFRDILALEKYPEIHTLRIYKSVVRNGRVIKLSGKTENSPRELPIPQRFYEFLTARREHVEGRISFPVTDEKTGKVFESVDELPIACHGDNFLMRCSSGDLSNAGQEFLRDDLGLSENTVKGIDEERQYDDVFLEKDATTYLLRRNMATHLLEQGLTEPEYQYFMGHKITDGLYRRSDFQDEDYLYRITEKLHLRLKKE